MLAFQASSQNMYIFCIIIIIPFSPICSHMYKYKMITVIFTYAILNTTTLCPNILSCWRIWSYIYISNLDQSLRYDHNFVRNKVCKEQVWKTWTWVLYPSENKTSCQFQNGTNLQRVNVFEMWLVLRGLNICGPCYKNIFVEPFRISSVCFEYREMLFFPTIFSI